MNLDVIAEYGVDNLVELVRVMNPGVEGKFLSLGPLGLDVVLPEEPLLPPGTGASEASHVVLLNHQVLV